MISKLDIIKLQDLPIESVADALGLEVCRHKAICPFHDDSHPSLTFHTGRNRYRCYVCDARGGTIDLVMNYNHLSFYDACLWLAKEFNIYLPEVGVREVQVVRTVRVVKKTPQTSQTIDTHFLEGLVSNPCLIKEAKKFLFEERHLDPRVVRWLGLSSISHPVPMSGNPNGSWFNAPSLLIPYRDVDGRLLSVQARYLGKEKDKPRFQFPKGSRCSIYNLPVLKLLRPGEPLFVTEGCSDCWSMLSAGHKAIAVPSATLLKDSDIEQVLKVVRQKFETFEKFEKYPAFHIFPDQDTAGEQLYQRLLQASLKFGFTLVRHNLPASCKDFSDLYLSNLKPKPG